MDKTVCASLESIKPDIFANGGDRSTEEVPESVICKKHNIQMTDGLGDKIRSSSDLTGLKQKIILWKLNLIFQMKSQM